MSPQTDSTPGGQRLPLSPPESVEHEKRETLPAAPAMKLASNGDATPDETDDLYGRQGPENQAKQTPISFSGEGDDDDDDADADADDEAWTGPIRYSKEYVDVTGAVTKKILGNEPTTITTSTSAGVLEVITQWHFGGRMRRMWSKKQKHRYLEKLAGRKGICRFRIHSAKLINVLRAVVDYYPGQELLGDVIEFTEPFVFLVHHWDKIEQYKTNHPPQHSAEYQRECNEHIDILLSELDKHVGPEIRLEKKRHSQGVATYEYLWVLFKPGEKLFARTQGLNFLRPCLQEKISGGISDRKGKPYRISAWYVGHNGIRFSRRELRAVIRPFDGEKEIMLLPIYPQAYHKDTPEELRSHDGRTLQEQTVVWGERCWNLRWPCLKEYSGKCLQPRRLPRIEGRVMIDEQSFILALETPFLGGNDLRQDGMSVIYDSDSESSDESSDDQREIIARKVHKRSPFMKHDTAYMGNRGCECDQCTKLGVLVKQTRYREYDDVDPNGEPPNTDHFFSLCGRSVGGFYLKERVFVLLDIDCVKEPTFDTNLFHYLVIDPDIKSTIKSLALNNARKGENKDKIKNGNGNEHEKSFGADFIQGKGEGQVFLLHGPPGVGKTCAAECVAELTQRPLLSFTSGDLGTKTAELDQKLSIFFRLGELWNAIVVIDEADIYFEERAPNDIARNSLVSVLLRALEYYKGILFLTTNRMGVLDEAFRSRIHVPLYFNDLTDEDRKQIWKNNIERLGETKIRITKEAQEYLVSQEVMALEWNGREIRNAFQTMVALAEAECEGETDEIAKITKGHAKEVVRISKEFRDYLSKLYRHIEFRELASRKGLRANMRSDDKGKRSGLVALRRRRGKQDSQFQTTSE